jgi:hypothetical protein
LPAMKPSSPIFSLPDTPPSQARQRLQGPSLLRDSGAGSSEQRNQPDLGRQCAPGLPIANIPIAFSGSFGFANRIVRELRTMRMLFYFLVLLMLERADDTCRRAQTATPLQQQEKTEALDGYLSEHRSIRTCRRSG